MIHIHELAFHAIGDRFWQHFTAIRQVPRMQWPFPFELSSGPAPRVIMDLANRNQRAPVRGQSCSVDEEGCRQGELADLLGGSTIC